MRVVDGLWKVDWRDMLEKYSFLYTEFGRWMNNSDRADRVQALSEELQKMSKIVGFSNLGLNGSIGLSFGARGKGGKTLAHFEPWDNIINLTKTHKGSFVHEWAHAVDFIIGAYVNQSKLHYPLTEGGESALRKAIADVVKERRKYPLPLRNAKYWGSAVEIWARTVEDWYSHKAKCKEEDIMCKSMEHYNKYTRVYMTDEARKRVFPMVDKVFKLIAKEVKKK